MREVKYLFKHLYELESFKEDFNSAIITDIDGTISEIVPTPSQAVIKPEIKDTMEKIAEKYKYAGVMTGRSINNALEMLESKKLIYIGNHGLEQYKNGKIIVDAEVGKYIPIIKKLAEDIKKRLGEYKCILFQNKELSFTVHYRLCENSDEIRKEALKVIKDLKESKSLKIAEGRKVIEIRPPIGHDKGTILQKFISENNIKKIIYLGDDITDSDAFKKLKELKDKKSVESFTIVVISKETPNFVKESADFYVNNVDEVYKFLIWLSK